MPTFGNMRMACETGYRYFRIAATASAPTNWIIDELRYIVDGTPRPGSPMTSNTAPAPLVASASSFYQAGNEAWKAFDYTGSGSTNAWLSGNGDGMPWLQIDFGLGVSVLPSAVSITIGDPPSGPNNFAIRASADGVNWATKLTVGSAGWTTPSETKVFAFTL